MKIKNQIEVTGKMINKYHEKCNSTSKVTVPKEIEIYKEAKWNKNQKSFKGKKCILKKIITKLMNKRLDHT